MREKHQTKSFFQKCLAFHVFPHIHVPRMLGYSLYFDDNFKQAGAEPGQAQIKLELGFTLIKI